MKVTFASNYYNHHQKMLSHALDSLTNHKYTFLSTTKMRLERKEMGYDDIERPSFVIETEEKNKKDIYKIIDNTDVVIVGSATSQVANYIGKSDILTFRYSERILREKISFFKYLYRFIKLRKRYSKKSRNYLLCAGAYVALDYTKFGLYKNQMYKWGYFPDTIIYDEVDSLIESKDPSLILWCGRLIDCKHPEHAIEIAKRLKDEGYIFEMHLIGKGEMYQQLSELVSKYSLKGFVKFLGVMKPKEVRKYMETAGIYLFTSDRHDGWGAVLNEAMNSGCAVVASNAVGSVPFLVNDKNNGLVYQSGSIESLYENTKLLLDNHKLQKQLGVSAYKTIIEEWNAEIAAERFINLAQHILSGENAPDLYETGPCSKADIIEDR